MGWVDRDHHRRPIAYRGGEVDPAVYFDVYID